MRKFSHHSALVFTCAVAILATNGCRSKSNDKLVTSQYCSTGQGLKLASVSNTPKTPPLSDSDLKKLVKKDIENFYSLDSLGPQALDQKYNNSFTRVFGGTGGSDVIRYFNERIHAFIYQSDKVTLYPGQFRYNGWSTEPCDPQNLNSTLEGADPNSGDAPSADVASSDGQNLANNPDVELGAANLGTELWYHAVIDRVPVSIDINGQRLSIDTTRVGLMMFGPSYKEYGLDPDGNKVLLPAAYRQEMLIHEARHSDCTGGVTDADLDIARQAKTRYEFFTNFTKRNCGHLHVYCPKGSLYHDVAACDEEPWGAYAVGAIYALAAARNATGNDQQILMVAAADSFRRLRYNAEDLLKGKFGPPDMTSSGLQP